MLKKIIQICGLFSFFTSVALALTGTEIVKKADYMRHFESDVSFIVEINDIQEKDVQKTRCKVYSKGNKVSRVEIVFPERQVGRKLLMTDEGLWLFTPDIKRPTRVSMQQRLTGEVSNGDIARTHFALDYAAEIKGEAKVNGRDAYFLHLTKTREDVTYAAIDYWIAKSDFAPIRAVFKTDAGKDLKVAEYSNPKPFLGRQMITKIEITSSLNSAHKSVLNYSNYRKEKLDESFFNKESLNN